MKLNDIGAPRGANKKIKRRGRGSGSGHGKTSCRGHKGSGSRTGTATRPGFEGGQMPIMRRMPKRGFTGKFSVQYQPVNVENLNRFENGTTVGPAELKKAGFITSEHGPVKLLGDGELKRSLTVKAHAASKSAKQKMKAAGAALELSAYVVAKAPEAKRKAHNV